MPQSGAVHSLSVVLGSTRTETAAAVLESVWQAVTRWGPGVGGKPHSIYPPWLGTVPILGNRHCYPHLTDDKIKSQRGDKLVQDHTVVSGKEPRVCTWASLTPRTKLPLSQGNHRPSSNPAPHFGFR